jgi:hypothetical protein
VPTSPVSSPRLETEYSSRLTREATCPDGSPTSRS